MFYLKFPRSLFCEWLLSRYVLFHSYIFSNLSEDITNIFIPSLQLPLLSICLICLYNLSLNVGRPFIFTNETLKIDWKLCTLNFLSGGQVSCIGGINLAAVFWLCISKRVYSHRLTYGKKCTSTLCAYSGYSTWGTYIDCLLFKKTDKQKKQLSTKLSFLYHYSYSHSTKYGSSYSFPKVMLGFHWHSFAFQSFRKYFFASLLGIKQYTQLCQ